MTRKTQKQKAAIIKQLNDSHKNSEGPFNEIRNTMNKQGDFFTNEMKTIRKIQSELLEIKNTMIQIKKNMESLNNRADIMEDRISN